MVQFGFEVLKLPLERVQIDRLRRGRSRQGFKTDLRFLQQAGLLLKQFALLLFQLGFLDAVGRQALKSRFDQVIGCALHEFPAGVLLVAGEKNQPVAAKTDSGLRHVPPEDLPIHFNPECVFFDPDRAKAGIQLRW